MATPVEPRRELGAGTAPAPAAAPEPKPADNQFKQLSDQLQNLTKLVQSERETLEHFESKVGSMEERMRFLQHLSEVISMNYNPFLEQEEGEVFEGLKLRVDESPPGGDAAPVEVPSPPPRNPLTEVVPVEADEDTTAPRRAVPPPAATVAAPTPSAPPSVRPLDADGDARGSPTGQPWAAAHDAPPAEASPAARDGEGPGGDGHGAARHAVGEPVGTRSATNLLSALQAADGPSEDAIRVRVGPDHPRDGHVPVVAPPPGALAPYVALRWFGHLLEHVEARHLHDLLDYYRDVGWMPARGHAWLVRLAEGVARRPKTPAEERERAPKTRRRGRAKRVRGPSPAERVRLHRDSLRFLERLFGPVRGEGDLMLLDRDLERLVREG